MSLNETPPQRPPAPQACDCLMCSAPVDAPDACCSFECTLAAEREVKHNVALLKVASGRQMSPEERLQLTQRNGSLSTALLSWRPDDRSS